MNSWLTGTARAEYKSKARRLPLLERLEERCVLSTTTGLITGEVFLDRNSNGTFDAGEIGVSGATVILYGTTNQGVEVSLSVQADGAGAFRIEHVLPGSYDVKVAPVAGLIGSPHVNWSLSAEDLSNFNLASPTPTGNNSLVGLDPNAISLRSFLSSGTNLTGFGSGGSGQALANYRSNTAPILATDLPVVNLGKAGEVTYVDMAAYFTDDDITNSQVTFNTSVGPINVTLFDTTAPQTVANFFEYVESGKYDATIFHRLQTGFVLQGGGFSFDEVNKFFPNVATGPTINNEFGASNTLGTLAMAKLPGQPDSATSQFFFNLANNTFLDTDSGGFTVFGKLTNEIDQIILNAFSSIFTSTDVSNGVPGSPFVNVPLTNYTGSDFPNDATLDNFARLLSISIVRRDEWLTYSVESNSNPDLEATFVGSQLKLSAPANTEGSATLMIKATDRYGASVITPLEVFFGNRAPTASVQFTPADPGRTETVTATVVASDLDGDPVTLTYSWLLNDVEVRRIVTTDTTDSLDLSDPSVQAQVGDVLKLVVTPSDGETDGADAVLEYTIVDHPPTITGLLFDNQYPSADEVLTIQVSAVDRDGDAITYNYVWEINDVVVREVNDSTSSSDQLDPSALVDVELAPGDTVRVSVSVNGPDGPGASSFLSIQINTPPTAEDVADQLFTGQGAYTFDASEAFSDADGHILTFTATLADGSALPDWLSVTTAGVLSGNPGTADEGTYEILITATDPGGLTAQTSFTLDVAPGDDGLNDPPVFSSIQISNISPVPDSVLTATANASDPEGTALTYSFVWTILRGEEVITLREVSGLTSNTDTIDLSELDVQVDDLLTVEATASDGEATGESGPLSVRIREA